jgi:predicted helicase
VIIGNPPYSSGQESANDNNANVAYPHLDERIEQPYAEFVAPIKIFMIHIFVQSLGE